MDYKKAIRQIVERRKNALSLAESTYDALCRQDEVISLLDGIKCGFKPTSCPDQLAVALQEALNEQN